MTSKKEIKELDKTFKIYTTLQLKVGKMDGFTPEKITEVVILGMKQMKKFKGLTGVQKKEKLIQMIKLLVKEHGDISEWLDFDTESLHSMIDSLYEGGILRSCCLC